MHRRKAQRPASAAVMARLDRAIHDKTKALSVLLDGWVKPGHDN
jgi:hypothetical protein